MKIKSKIYAQALLELLADESDRKKADKIISVFITLIKKKAATRKIAGKIVADFESLCSESSLLKVESYPILDDEFASRLAASFSRALKISPERVKIQTIENPSLLGGVKVTINNTVINDSVQEKIRRLTKLLSEDL